MRNKSKAAQKCACLHCLCPTITRLPRNQSSTIKYPSNPHHFPQNSLLCLFTLLFNMNGHDHMSHGGMGHGGMDMPSKAPMCNMNVNTPFGLPLLQTILQPLIAHRSPPDALHLGHDEPVYCLPPMACLLHTRPDRFPFRHRPSNGGL